jgi:hypothetical protein
MDFETAKKMLQLWIDAEVAAASGHSYTIDGLSLTRQDIDKIRRQILYYQNFIAAFTVRGSSLLQPVRAVDRGQYE